MTNPFHFRLLKGDTVDERVEYKRERAKFLGVLIDNPDLTLAGAYERQRRPLRKYHDTHAAKKGKGKGKKDPSFQET